jgi:membrane-associated protease RseP (regulator of RpoE activity)
MAQSIRTFSPTLTLFNRPYSKPSAREWRIHGFLFALTILTTVLAGIMLAAPELPIVDPPLARPIDYLLYIPIAYIRSLEQLFNYVLLNHSVAWRGVSFSGSLLAVLFSHEMGHYFACRYYGVDATLPFFIPAPPLFLAGTFGAFIKIRSAIPTRRSLFDIGLAGPLAGFIVAVPLAIAGILTLQPPLPAGSGITFNDPLLFKLLARALHVQLEPNSPINPFYMAAWIGLLVTSLNLMPVGQLDGGHGTFALFGATAHKLIGRLALFIMAILAVLGFWLHGSPSGFLYVVLLAIMLRIRHPQPEVFEELDGKRILIAIVTLLVFLLSFSPFPITLS